jgi:hypothetical protein
MRSRCNSPNNPDFHHYGGRGIKVCQEWNDFAQFRSDMGERPQGGTIERIDVNGGYNKDNVRWASQKEQCRNKRNNVLTKKLAAEIRNLDSTGLGIAELAKRFGVSQAVIRSVISCRTWMD